jgi:hypothetical protein
MIAGFLRPACTSGLVLIISTLAANGREQPVQQGTRKEYFLKYHLSVNVTREVGPGGQNVQFVARPASLQEEPKYQSREPLYATLYLGSKKDPFTVVLDSSSGADHGHDILYVDMDHDGHITDGKKFTSFLTNSGSVFGPVKFMVNYGKEKSPQWFWFQLIEHVEGKNRVVRGLQAINAGYYEGVVAFGDQKRRIAVVDADGNGLYNDWFKGDEQAGDRVVIGRDPTDKGGGGAKAEPLARYVLVGDRYWQMDVAPDGSSLAVQALNRPTGTIRVSQKNCALTLSNEDCLLQVQATDGVARVPTGKYRLIGCHYQLAESVNRVWRFSSLNTSGTMVDVPAEGEVKLAMGPPFEPKVTVTIPEEGHLALSISLAGAGGEMVNSVQLATMGRPPRPQARILDSSGRELGLVDFHFG